MFRKRFRRKRIALFKSAQWNFHQDNAPILNSILVTDYLTKMGINTVPQLPRVQMLLPVTFGFSLSSEAVVMRQLSRWKRLWRRSLTRSYKRTSIWPSRSCWNGTTSALQPEEITLKGTRVSWVYYQLKCPYEKVWKLVWNSYKLEAVQENESYEILWEFEIKKKTN